MAVTQKAPQFPLTDANGRNYRTYKNKRGRTVKVYEPRPADYTPPLTERDKKEAVIAAYSGEPKKGDYIPGNKGSGVVYDGEKWVYHGQGAFKSKSAGGKEYFTDARFDEAVNNLSPEAWRDLEKKGIVDSKNVDYYANNPLPVESPDGTELVKYPNDIVNSDTDYMMFKFYEYVPPFGSEVERPRDNFFDPESKKSKSQVLNQTLGAYNSSVSFSAKEAEGYKTIILYMPEDIGDAFSAGWQGKAFGNISAGIISSTAGSKNFINAIGKLKDTSGGALKRLQTNAAAEAITKLAGSITGDQITASDVFSSAKGVIRNPNTEVLFQNMNLRTFDHSFKMAPYNRKDEENIQTIIKEFKRAMLPSYSIGKTDLANGNSAEVDAAFIKVPKLVQVTYMRGGSQHTHLPKYKLCALTDVSVGYTPDNNYATFKSGGPVAYELKLNFLETKLIYSEEIATGNH